jgi:hypothetical protein
MSKATKKIHPAARLKKFWQKHIGRTPKNPHRAFKMTRSRFYVPTSQDIKATWRLITESWKFIFRDKKSRWVLLGLAVLFAAIAYFLVGGVSQIDFIAFKDATVQIADGNLTAVDTALALFGSAVTGNLTAPPTDVQQFLSTTLILFFWLALIWATRMLSADKDIKLRDALYNSGTPIVPTLVVLSIIAVQLIPAALGVFVYATALNGGWLTGGVESMIFAAVAVLLSLLSAYFMVSSLTALIIVTLPGTYPWQALRSARELVMNRRWGLVLRILALALQMLLLWAVVLIPVFLLDNWLRFDWLPLVPIFVQALLGFTLLYTSVYIYKLYRSLL